jgi:hypothetical protein
MSSRLRNNDLATLPLGLFDPLTSLVSDSLYVLLGLYQTDYRRYISGSKTHLPRHRRRLSGNPFDCCNDTFAVLDSVRSKTGSFYRAQCATPVVATLPLSEPVECSSVDEP